MTTFEKLMAEVNARAEHRRASDREVARLTGVTVAELDTDTTRPDEQPYHITVMPYSPEMVEVRIQHGGGDGYESGDYVYKADMAALVAQHSPAVVYVDGQTLDLSDHRLDIPPYFEGDRAALIVWLQDAVKYRQHIVEEYKRGWRGRSLDAAGRKEMLAEAKGILAAMEQQLRLQQAALAVGL